MTFTPKTFLRETSLGKRGALPATDHAAFSQACCGRLCAFIETVAPLPRIISGYIPIRSELAITEALRKLGESHITALPVILKDSRILAFRRFASGDALAPGSYGIGEPESDAEEVIPDILIVPLLAFDRSGQRLGYGAGHYDATLAHLRRLKPVMAVGVGFALQETDAIPAEAFDQRLDAVVTEKEIVKFT